MYTAVIMTYFDHEGKILTDFTIWFKYLSRETNEIRTITSFWIRIRGSCNKMTTCAFQVGRFCNHSACLFCLRTVGNSLMTQMQLLFADCMVKLLFCSRWRVIRLHERTSTCSRCYSIAKINLGLLTANYDKK